MSILKKLFVNLIPPKVLIILADVFFSFCTTVYVTNVYILRPIYSSFIFMGIFAIQGIILYAIGRTLKSTPSPQVILLSAATAVLVIVVCRNVFFPTRQETYISLTAEAAGEICLCDLVIDGENIPVAEAYVVENSGWLYREQWDNFMIWTEEDGVENRLTLRFVADEVRLAFPYTPYAGSVTIVSSAGRDGGTWDLRCPEWKEGEAVQYADFSFDCHKIYSPLELLLYGAGILPLLFFVSLFPLYAADLAWKKGLLKTGLFMTNEKLKFMISKVEFARIYFGMKRRYNMISGILKEGYMSDLLKRLEMRFKVTFGGVLIWGIIAHGMCLFNKYSFRDDAQSLFWVGGTYTYGRWMLGILAKISAVFFQSQQYSIPLFNGMLSLLLIAIAACIFVELFDIQSLRLCVGLSGIMVTFPSVTGLFGYMYTAPYYMTGFFFAVLGLFFTCKYRKLCWLGVILICCSLGVYQAYYPIVVSSFLIYMVKSVTESEAAKIGKFVKDAMYYVSICILSMILYFIMNEFFLWKHNLVLTDYMGISSMGKESWGTYISLVKRAYLNFFQSNQVSLIANMHIMGARILYKIMLGIMIVLFAIFICEIFVKEKKKAIQIVCLMAFFPLAINLIFVMVKEVHALMVYGQVMLFVYYSWFLEHAKIRIKIVERNIYSLLSICLILFSVVYCRYDNICYLKAEFQQQQAISYFTTLITQIKSVEGYKDEMPITFINGRNIQDLSVTTNDEFNIIRITPYGGDTLITSYSWLTFIKNWCGYAPVVIESEAFEELPEVKSMTSYPDDGSIKVISDTVVIKF